jgi:hypothetical protein
MLRSWVSSESGSAILEFILFVVVGQMLVFAGSLSISTTLESKVELQILATNAITSISLNQDPLIPSGVELIRRACSAELVCLSLRKGSLLVSAVGYK